MKVKYLLLIWRGEWMNDGPNHGRDCLFKSEQDALNWIKDEYEGSLFVSHVIQSLIMPKDLIL